jgi:hypothetical protein
MSLVDDYLNALKSHGRTGLTGGSGTYRGTPAAPVFPPPVPVDPRTGGSTYNTYPLKPGGNLGDFISGAPYTPPLSGGSPTYNASGTTFTTQPLAFGPRPSGTTYTTQPINTGGTTYTTQPISPVPVAGPAPAAPPVNLSNPTIPLGNNGSLYTSPLSREYGEQNPLAEYTRALTRAGTDPFSRYGQFAQNQSSNYIKGFQSALLDNPFLKLRDYMKANPISAGLHNQFAGLTPNQRGLNNQSRSSVIRWG